MKTQKLNFRFHNPNTAEAAAGYILDILIEANKAKLEQAVQTAASSFEQQIRIQKSRSA
ncbi:hypothetical protein [Ethanoligenens harbinense]|uniref:Uncharacterized protein n=1 Tax=Ethanoligenens harbinense (strain DSM 18485 / JCM 12961 / CGMCC 1.5033 / YUAN-3) TaxID=663278 RepID=E6U9W5_ETHHY|nr:hypothetical protein [Ethanoligenens harbinense]ADU26231.1 hypothetical protein Ethha_0662 [Ethanoligenens harbinense YUAN-3]